MPVGLADVIGVDHESFGEPGCQPIAGVLSAFDGFELGMLTVLVTVGKLK